MADPLRGMSWESTADSLWSTVLPLMNRCRWDVWQEDFLRCQYGERWEDRLLDVARQLQVEAVDHDQEPW